MAGDRQKRIGYGILGTLVAGAVFALYRFDPATATVFPPCPFHLMTGHHCPGCGSLRALHSLLHGHLVGAVSLNPLMVVSIPVLGVLCLDPSWVYRRWVPWVALGILMTYGIARNIPYWPFVFLAPG